MMSSVSTSEGFPRYSRAERRLDLVLHVAGLAMGVIGVALLAALGIGRADAASALGVSLYAASLLAMLALSASYNLSRRRRRKEILRRLDRAAIFAMIAGTYSPFALSSIGGAVGLGLFAFEWGLASLGAAIALAFPRRSDRVALVLYLAMGWALVLVAEPLAAAVPAHAVALLVGGGVVYTLGVALHVAEGLRYHNALWHACVLAAAGCHYLAVLDSFAAAAA